MTSLEASEQLGKPAPVGDGHVELRGDHPVGLVHEPVAEAGGADGVVMGPHRAVVADRVVCGHRGCQRADAPSGEEVVGHQPASDQLGSLRVDDPGPEAVSDVGRHGVDGFLVAVQAQGVGKVLVEPEVLVEPPAEVGTADCVDDGPR